MSTNGSPRAVIVGYGETEYHKKSEFPPLWYISDAVSRALSHAGMAKAEVDGLALTSFQLPPDNVTCVAQHLGLELGWAFQGAYGGASGVISVLHAARAIRDGLAKVVVCVAADAFSVHSHMQLMNQFNSAMHDYIAPYDSGGTNGLFALVQRRHMWEYGTTLEQFGKLAVTQRMHASLNPNALLRSPMQLEDYLSSRLICDPIRLYDCVLPCSGGDAVVLTTEERARDLPRRPLHILAGGERHNYRPDDIVVLNAGWQAFQSEMFARAGCNHDAIDFVQFYDDYPIMEVIQLEDLGFCAKGEGGAFVADTDFSIHGRLPLNTGGGQLSAGQCGAGGGMIGVVEGVCQLQLEAGARQVPNPSIGLITGFGMVAYVRGLSSSAMILTNERQ